MPELIEHLSTETLRQIHARMQRAAEQVRLPFERRVWRGIAGNFQGAGSGSSIDFQDHRPYLPGDDIRYINWQAYARTGHYIIKLYREEVRPSIEVLMDFSPSMFFEPDKAQRSLELLYFTLENAARAEASLRCYLLNGTRKPLLQNREHLLAYHFEHNASPLTEMASLAEQVAAVPFQQGSMRILISDLLYEEPPLAVLNRLVHHSGKAVIFAPFCREEAEPDWWGTIEFEDCESRRRRIQKAPTDLVKRYRETYLRHFAIWKELARGHDIPLARVPSENNFREALQFEALQAGAIELWK